MPADYVWIVYSKDMFVGYSESLGNGRETKSLVKIFSTEAKANKFIFDNRSKYTSQDKELTYEKEELDVDADKETSPEDVANFFKSYHS